MGLIVLLLTCACVISTARVQGIAHGIPARPGELPFVVYLDVVDYDTWGMSGCGGSIVSPNVVVTAAHCVHNITETAEGDVKLRVKVVAGDIRLRRSPNAKNGARRTRQVRLVKQIFFPESYNDEKAFSDFLNDIAVLILSHPFEFNSFVSSIEIPEKDQQMDFSDTVKICGWGQTESGDQSPVLLKGQVEILSDQKCEEDALILVDKYKIEVNNTHSYESNSTLTEDGIICAAGRDSAAICKGDSGGPLILKVGGHEYFFGVASSAAAAGGVCGQYQPSLQWFTAVSNFSEWITQKIEGFSFTCNTASSTSSQFSCGNGDCVPLSSRCDRKVDCPGGIDEIACEPCQQAQFLCTGKVKCIDQAYVCDMVHDCGDADGSDELGCSSPGCEMDQFWCGDEKSGAALGNGSCVHKSFVCDGVKHCPNAGDEFGCGECLPTEFRCDNGQCVHASAVCDGTPTCQDFSDERGCKNLTVTAVLDVLWTSCDRRLDLGSCLSRESCIFNEYRRECVVNFGDSPEEDTEMNMKANGTETEKHELSTKRAEFLLDSFIIIGVVIGVGLFLAFGLALLWFDIRRVFRLRSPQQIPVNTELLDYYKSP